MKETNTTASLQYFVRQFVVAGLGVELARHGSGFCQLDSCTVVSVIQQRIINSDFVVFLVAGEL